MSEVEQPRKEGREDDFLETMEGEPIELDKQQAQAPSKQPLAIPDRIDCRMDRILLVVGAIVCVLFMLAGSLPGWILGVLIGLVGLGRLSTHAMHNRTIDQIEKTDGEEARRLCEKLTAHTEYRKIHFGVYYTGMCVVFVSVLFKSWLGWLFGLAIAGAGLYRASAIEAGERRLFRK